MAGWGLQAARGVPTIKILKQCLGRAPLASMPDGIALFQYYDFAEINVRSIAYGRRAGSNHDVWLVPDAYFFDTQGYARVREAVTKGLLVPWQERPASFFWRGSPTFNLINDHGGRITSFDEIPRVAMCQRLKSDPRADAGLIGPWGQYHFKKSMSDFLRDENLLRPRVDLLQTAGHHRFWFDIDGVANAWGLLEKMMMGACVLKVASQYEQWFYDRLEPWQHFVPLAGDLSDLQERMDWCLSHSAEAGEIARRAQDLALSYTIDGARDVVVEAVQNCLAQDISLDEGVHLA